MSPRLPRAGLCRVKVLFTILAVFTFWVIMPTVLPVKFDLCTLMVWLPAARVALMPHDSFWKVQASAALLLPTLYPASIEYMP